MDLDELLKERDRPCVYQYYPATWQGPAEYCWEMAEEDSEYCADHDPDNWQPDWDDRRKDMMYDCE